jgi:hypothetical protein
VSEAVDGQEAASATSNNSAGRRIPQPRHAESTRALAGVLDPFTHAAQQSGPPERFRQEITPCRCGLLPIGHAAIAGVHDGDESEGVPEHVVVTACVGAGWTSVAKLMCEVSRKNARMASLKKLLIGSILGATSPTAGPKLVGMMNDDPG